MWAFHFTILSPSVLCVLPFDRAANGCLLISRRHAGGRNRTHGLDKLSEAVTALAISITRRSSCWIERLRRKLDPQCPPVWPILTRSELNSHPARCSSGSGIDGRSG